MHPARVDGATLRHAMARIVQVCLRYPPASGGVERNVHALGERLRAAGHDVPVVTSDLRTHDPAEPLDARELARDPSHVVRLSHRPTRGLPYPRLPGITAALDRLRPDVVHAHAFWYPPADAAARWCRRRRVPLVLFPYYYENRLRRRPPWRLYRRTIGATTFRCADAVVTISPDESERITDAGLRMRKELRLPPPIDVERFERPRPDPFLARGITGRVLLAVGRLSRGKRLAEGVAAMPDLLRSAPDLQLVIVGEDFGEREALAKHAADLGLAQRVHLLGFVPDDELAAAYRAATLLVHPSSHEAFGIVLAEAMAAGTPVVARRVAAIPQTVPDGRCGLLFDDAAGLAAAVLRLLGDEPLRRRLGDAGRAHVREHFSWGRALARLDALHRALGVPGC